MRKLLLAAMIFGGVSVEAEESAREPTTLHYDTTANGPWAAAESWQERLAPIAGDVLSVSGRATLTEADSAAATIAADIVVDEGATLTVSNETALALGARIHGAGSVVKLGGGMLDLVRSATTSVDFRISGGLVISNGIVRYAATTVQPFEMGKVAVWAPGELQVPDGPDLNLNISNICGDGTISNPNGVNNVQLRFSGKGVWDGCLKGKHLRVYMPGDVVFTCPTSTIEYAEFCAFGGCISFTSFGMCKSPSTTGYATSIRGRDAGGTIRYVGTADETTDKTIYFSRRNLTERGVLDGGAHGGVTFTGSVSASVDNKWSCLYLTGSNSVPMVIAGAYDEVSTGPGYIVKTGSGTWHFKDTTSTRAQHGVYELREGVLRFDSIANYGETCSLGPQNRLVASTNAIGNITPSADYAFLLGTQAGCEPVLEYTGEGAGKTDRRIAVAGTARLRNTSSRRPLRWHGGAVPHGADALTRRQLILEGCEGVTNRIDNLQDRDGQTFDLVVDGGVWELGTNNTFTGKVTVRRGKLLAVPHKVSYTWYKWRLRETSGGRKARNGGTCADSNAGAREIAFFDATGKNVALKAFTERSDRNASLLQPGEMCYDGNVASTYYDGRELANLVNGESGKEWLIFPRSAPCRLDKSASWFSVVFRLPEAVADVVAYDVWTYGTTSDRSVCDWEMFASEDGENWVKVDEQAPDASQANWFSKSTSSVGSAARDLATDKFFPITYPTEDTTGYGASSISSLAVETGAIYEGREDLAVDFPSHFVVTRDGDMGGFTKLRIPATGVFDVTMACDWFRVFLMETRAGQEAREQGTSASDPNVQMQELAFYDAKGNRVNKGLVMAPAGGMANLRPGEVCYTVKGVNDYKTRTPSLLFDDSTSDTGLCATLQESAARVDDPTKWITFVLRLAGDGARAESYDWLSGYSNYKRDLMAWKIEASADGSVWTLVAEGTHGDTTASKWYFDGTSFKAGAVRTGYPFDYRALAKKVSLRGFSCKIDLAGCTGLENFSNWTVAVNGILREKARIVYADGAFSIIPPGAVLLVR